MGKNEYQKITTWYQDLKKKEVKFQIEIPVNIEQQTKDERTHN